MSVRTEGKSSRTAQGTATNFADRSHAFPWPNARAAQAPARGRADQLMKGTASAVDRRREPGGGTPSGKPPRPRARSCCSWMPRAIARAPAREALRPTLTRLRCDLELGLGLTHGT